MSRRISDSMIRADNRSMPGPLSEAKSGFESCRGSGLQLLIHPGHERGNVAIDVLDRRIGEVDGPQMKGQQKAMIPHAPMARLTQLPARKPRSVSLTGSVSPAIRIIARPLLPTISVITQSSLMLASSRVF